jgi:hypothetical protein
VDRVVGKSALRPGGGEPDLGLFFQKGLVEDFGARGDPPPEQPLLDWLALDFVGSGFSVRHVARRIVTRRRTGRVHSERSADTPLARSYSFRVTARRTAVIASPSRTTSPIPQELPMSTTRRQFLGSTAVFGGAALAGATLPLSKTFANLPRVGSKKILILGGTGFLGPKTIAAALARGHKVTVFNRGKREKYVPVDLKDVEHLYGNRDPELPADDERGDDKKLLHPDAKPKGLEQLEGKTFDAVIDNSGYFPRMVKASADLTAKNGAKQYIFISSISAYASMAKPNADEDAELAKLEDPKGRGVWSELPELRRREGPVRAGRRGGVPRPRDDRAARLHRRAGGSDRPVHVLARPHRTGRRSADPRLALRPDRDHRRPRPRRVARQARRGRHGGNLQRDRAVEVGRRRAGLRGRGEDAGEADLGPDGVAREERHGAARTLSRSGRRRAARPPARTRGSTTAR